MDAIAAPISRAIGSASAAFVEHCIVVFASAVAAILVLPLCLCAADDSRLTAAAAHRLRPPSSLAMKLDAAVLRYLTRDDFRVLTGQSSSHRTRSDATAADSSGEGEESVRATRHRVDCGVSCGCAAVNRVELNSCGPAAVRC